MSMGMHANDHEIKIGSTTKGLKLIRNEDGSAMYQVIEEIPQYRDPLLYTQTNWIDGHGQHDLLNPEAYFEGQSIDTTQEGRIFLGPLINTVGEIGDSGNLDSAVVKFAWDSTNSKLLCITAAKAYIYSTGWTAATDTVAGGTDLREFGAYMFVARGSSTAYMYSNDGGDNWTASTLTTKTFQKFLVSHNAAGTAEVLWSFKQPNEVYSNAGTGINGGTEWGSAAYIGDSANNITTLFLSNDNFMVGREDGLFHYDSDGGQHQLRPDLRANRSTDNFKHVTEWQAGVYHSEIDGMGEITSYNAYEPMGPLQNLGDIGKRGDIVGLAADKDWIYVAIYDGTNYWIYKGREVRKGGALRWQWCPWVYCGTNAIATMLVVQHSTTDRRLWFGYGTTTAYVILSDNPTADSAARFATSGHLRMSYDYGTDPNWDKLWQSAVIEQTRYNSGAQTAASAGETVQLKYRDDMDTSATSIISVYICQVVSNLCYITLKAILSIEFYH